MGKTVSHPFHDIGNRLGEIVLCAVDKMSVAKVAAIGASGSVASAAAGSVPDFTHINAYADMIVKVGGATGVIFSIALMGFKGWLMWQHRDKPPR